MYIRFMFNSDLDDIAGSSSMRSICRPSQNVLPGPIGSIQSPRAMSATTVARNLSASALRRTVFLRAFRVALDDTSARDIPSGDVLVSG